MKLEMVRPHSMYMWTNGMDKITDFVVDNDLWHFSGTLTFLTLTALIICGASLEIIHKEECKGTEVKEYSYKDVSMLP